MKKIQVYECEHCKKYYKKSASSVKDHEKICFYNPRNKSCVTCSYLCYEDDKPYCRKLNIKIKFHPRDLVPDAVQAKVLCGSWKDQEVAQLRHSFEIDFEIYENKSQIIEDYILTTEADFDWFHDRGSMLEAQEFIKELKSMLNEIKGA